MRTPTQQVLLAFGAMLALAACGGSGGDDATQAASTYPQPLMNAPSVAVVAHRGGAAYAPENTAVALLNAYRLGVDAIELDVRMNASGDFVVVHDDDLARTTNCSVTISKSQSSALDGCDAAYNWSPAFRTDVAPRLLAGRGIAVPLLRSVLEAADQLKAPPVTLWIELKSQSPYSAADIQATVSKFVQLLSERLWRATVVLQSFDGYVLSQFKIRYPGSKTLLLWAPVSGSSYTCAAAVVEATSRQIDILGIPPLQMPLAEAKECAIQAKQNGLSIAVYTINKVTDFLNSLGVDPDAVISDFPACLQSVLGRPIPSNPYPVELSSGEFQPKCPG